MALPAFDTHDYVKKLQAVGFSEKQAEVQAELQSQILSSLIVDKLSTKDDIKTLRNELKDDITALRNEMNESFIKIDGRFNLFTWMLGLNSAAIVYIASKIFLLHV